MHDSVMAYAREMLTGRLDGCAVLEVGSYDVNGNLRELCTELGCDTYYGTDMRSGPGVDLAASAEDLPGLFTETFDVVCSTEMLEHAEYWKAALWGMVQTCRIRGHLLLTCRGPGAGYHPHPEDYWRFSTAVVETSLRALGCRVIDCREDTGDAGVLAFAERLGRFRPGAIPDAQRIDKPPLSL